MLELEHISVRFAAGHGVQAVEDVTLTLEDGGRLAIVGETGSGKSVLLLAVLQLLPGSALVSRQRPGWTERICLPPGRSGFGRSGAASSPMCPRGVEPA